ncbi:inorganic phosphate transporter [Salinigranum sp. GCM10025319]|uniref:inorganic phosphate transporter n=1 Tax=Salinigranum sp. GCM10025319 TaxID=3252687 RepID=UPI003A975A68
MGATAPLATFVVAALASLFMAWSIGAGSSGSTPFAAAVGANAISVMRAGLVVGVLGFLGAVLQGANVTQAVGTELVAGATLSATAAIVALLVAAALVAIGVFAGYPIATAFTVTGAVIGVGLALGGDPAWAKYREIATLWVLTPFVGGGVAYATARMLRNESVPERLAVPFLAGLVGAIVANIEFAILPGAGGSGSIASTVVRASGVPSTPLVARLVVTIAVSALVVVALAYEMRSHEARGQRRFLLVLGGLVAFSAGGSQVGLAIGPLVPLLGEFAVPPPGGARGWRPRPPRGIVDRRAADDQGARAGLLVARTAAVDRRDDPVVRDRPDRRRVRHPGLVQRDHRQRDHRLGLRRRQRGGVAASARRRWDTRCSRGSGRSRSRSASATARSPRSTHSSEDDPSDSVDSSTPSSSPAGFDGTSSSRTVGGRPDALCRSDAIVSAAAASRSWARTNRQRR